MDSTVAVQTKGLGWSFHKARNSAMAFYRSSTLLNESRRTRLVVNSANQRSIFFFSSRRRHTRCYRDWSSDCALPISLGLRLPGADGATDEHGHGGGSAGGRRPNGRSARPLTARAARPRALLSAGGWDASGWERRVAAPAPLCESNRKAMGHEKADCE